MPPRARRRLEELLGLLASAGATGSLARAAEQAQGTTTRAAESADETVGALPDAPAPQSVEDFLSSLASETTGRADLVEGVVRQRLDDPLVNRTVDDVAALALAQPPAAAAAAAAAAAEAESAAAQGQDAGTAALQQQLADLSARRQGAEETASQVSEDATQAADDAVSALIQLLGEAQSAAESEASAAVSQVQDTVLPVLAGAEEDAATARASAEEQADGARDDADAAFQQYVQPRLNNLEDFVEESPDPVDLIYELSRLSPLVAQIRRSTDEPVRSLLPEDAELVRDEYQERTNGGVGALLAHTLAGLDPMVEAVRRDVDERPGEVEQGIRQSPAGPLVEAVEGEAARPPSETLGPLFAALGDGLLKRVPPEVREPVEGAQQRTLEALDGAGPAAGTELAAIQTQLSGALSEAEKQTGAAPDETAALLAALQQAAANQAEGTGQTISEATDPVLNDFEQGLSHFGQQVDAVVASLSQGADAAEADVKRRLAPFLAMLQEQGSVLSGLLLGAAQGASGLISSTTGSLMDSLPSLPSLPSTPSLPG